MIQVYYFAGLRDAAGKAEETIDRENWKVQDLLDWVEETYPAFRNKTVFVAVNEEYASQEDVIHSGDIVALIPPVSGG
ncbi:molybdopterin converting factor subunit 1 [Paenibacillus solani]|uniref:molybdopterin converting factor subunit 1 n=1 Tax=Paenibacillus solani TaxID=1705565 RepID=UPI003D2DB7AC